MKTMMNLSPEFKRNLWLEISLNRLILMPAFLFALVYLTYLSADIKIAEKISNFSAFLFIAVATIWGGRSAWYGLSDEIRNHTWDWQRLSAIGPWQMSWSKLFGPTLYNWYGGLICLVIYIVSSTLAGQSGLIYPLLLLIGAALLGQAICLLSVLLILQRKGQQAKQVSSLIFSLIATVAVLFSLASLIDLHKFADDSVLVFWHSITFQKNQFILITLWVYTAWAMLAVYRGFRKELQLQNQPWVWLCFTLFIVLYITGFVEPDSLSSGNVENKYFTPSPYLIGIKLTVAYYLTLWLTLFMLFIESKSPVIFRQLRKDWQNHAWQKLSLHLPRWISTFLLATLLLVIAALFVLATANHTKPTGQYYLFIISGWLLLARDIGWILFLNFARNPKRADGATVLYLAIVYFVLPMIFSEVEFTALEQAFWPSFKMGLTALLIQLGLATLTGVLCYRRWKQNSVA